MKGYRLVRDPIQNRFNRRNLAARWQFSPIDHDHGQSQLSGRNKLGLGADSTAVFANNNVHAKFFHHCEVTGQGKRPSAYNDSMMWQRRRRLWLVDKPQNVVMLGLIGKGRYVLFAKREQNPSGLSLQSIDRAANVRDVRPKIFFPGFPRWARQSDQLHSRTLTCMKRVPTHLSSKGMRGIDNMRDIVGAQVSNKAIDPSEPANPRWQRLGLGSCNAASIGKHGVHSTLGHKRGQLARLGGSAKDKEFGCHVC
ncbi:hypothetical protein BXY66_2264 [Shimia isoporae]|uniref:Uncharacterized protein n=1 Tax=Shimia isoporae TaxID=647720 RepID=A0A4R1NPN3_9RHOB|nr:hypothetical protein BXY66_2264 [Shimia isoporae]